MLLLRDLAQELLKMFLADARLTLATLALVAASAGLIFWIGAPALCGGGLFSLGCVAILLEAVFREARRRRAGKR